MADEGDSKSLVLITRVGSTPTTGIESSSKSKGFGLLFFFIPPTSGPSSHVCLHRETADGVLEGTINAELKKASELSTDPKYPEAPVLFCYAKKMLSWISCSNSSNRAQEKNAASVIARVQELVLFTIRSCVIAREHTDRQNKKVSPTVKMKDSS